MLGDLTSQLACRRRHKVHQVLPASHPHLAACPPPPPAPPLMVLLRQQQTCSAAHQGCTSTRLRLLLPRARRQQVQWRMRWGRESKARHLLRPAAQPPLEPPACAEPAACAESVPAAVPEAAYRHTLCASPCPAAAGCTSTTSAPAR